MLGDILCSAGLCFERCSRAQGLPLLLQENQHLSPSPVLQEQCAQPSGPAVAPVGLAGFLGDFWDGLPLSLSGAAGITQ